MKVWLHISTWSLDKFGWCFIKVFWGLFVKCFLKEFIFGFSSFKRVFTIRSNEMWMSLEWLLNEHQMRKFQLDKDKSLDAHSSQFEWDYHVRSNEVFVGWNEIMFLFKRTICFLLNDLPWKRVASKFMFLINTQVWHQFFERSFAKMIFKLYFMPPRP